MALIACALIRRKQVRHYSNHAHKYTLKASSISGIIYFLLGQRKVVLLLHRDGGAMNKCRASLSRVMRSAVSISASLPITNSLPACEMRSLFIHQTARHGSFEMGKKNRYRKRVLSS